MLSAAKDLFICERFLYFQLPEEGMIAHIYIFYLDYPLCSGQTPEKDNRDRCFFTSSFFHYPLGHVNPTLKSFRRKIPILQSFHFSKLTLCEVGECADNFGVVCKGTVSPELCVN